MVKIKTGFMPNQDPCPEINLQNVYKRVRAVDLTTLPDNTILEVLCTLSYTLRINDTPIGKSVDIWNSGDRNGLHGLIDYLVSHNGKDNNFKLGFISTKMITYWPYFSYDIRDEVAFVREPSESWFDTPRRILVQYPEHSS